MLWWLLVGFAAVLFVTWQMAASVLRTRHERADVRRGAKAQDTRNGDGGISCVSGGGDDSSGCGGDGGGGGD